MTGFVSQRRANPTWHIQNLFCFRTLLYPEETGRRDRVKTKARRRRRRRRPEGTHGGVLAIPVAVATMSLGQTL